MNFNSQICTTEEQSERLLALGLKKETADMYYPMELYGGELPVIADAKFGCPKGTLPAWSLDRLIKLSNIQRFHIVDKVFVEDGVSNIWCGDYGNKLYDNTIDLIEWLIKEGYFNKEYLEE